MCSKVSDPEPEVGSDPEPGSRVRSGSLAVGSDPVAWQSGQVDGVEV